MKYVLCSMYDRVAGTFAAPMAFVNRSCAQRWFRTVSKQSEFAQPTDFELYAVGEYDTNTGLIKSYDKPDFIEKGVYEDEA